MTEPSVDEWHLVSDLHLGTEGSERQSAAFVRFLDALRDGCETGHTDLVLLGDVFELYPENSDGINLASLRSSLSRLHANLTNHPDVLEALASVLRSGIGVRVVPGNHDLDFHRFEVQDALREALRVAGAGSAADITFHPWIYSVPGVLHAEHGHRYHDINAVPVNPVLPSNELFLPAATRAVHDERPFALAVLAAIRNEGRPWFRRRPLLWPPETTKLASSMSVDPIAVQRLDRLASPTILSTVARLLRSAMQGSRHAGEYLERSAPNISAAFRSLNPRPVVHAFGHTHRATIRGLSTGAVYANCGTWTERYPRPHPEPTDRKYTWLRVRRHTSTAQVAVLEWLDDRSVNRTISALEVPLRGSSPRGIRIPGAS